MARLMKTMPVSIWRATRFPRSTSLVITVPPRPYGRVICQFDRFILILHAENERYWSEKLLVVGWIVEVDVSQDRWLKEISLSVHSFPAHKNLRAAVDRCLNLLLYKLKRGLSTKWTQCRLIIGRIARD